MRRSQVNRVISAFVVVLLVIGLLPGLSAGPARAQSDQLTAPEFRDLVRNAEKAEPVYGPESGDLDQDPDVVTFSNADVDLANVLIEATFTNPYSPDDGQFDFGVQLRSTSSGREATNIRVLVLSTGAFGVVESDKDELSLQGTYDGLDTASDGQNDLAVYADDDTLHVAINGDYVGSAQVDLTDSGDVAVGTSFLPDSYQRGATTSFDDFTVWDLDAKAGTGTSKPGKKTPTPSADAKPTKTASKKRTPTPEAKDEGTVFQSDSYDFSFRYSDEWTVSDPVEGDQFELIPLSDDASTMQILVGDRFDNPTDCYQGLITVITGLLDQEGVQYDLSSPDGEQSIDKGPRAGSLAATVDIAITSGNMDDQTLYVECGPVGDADYLVGVSQLVAADAYKGEVKKRQAIIDTFNNTDINTDSDTTDDSGSKSNGDTGSKSNSGKSGGKSGGKAGDKISDHVIAESDGGATYTSPTYGFEVGILPGYTVEEDSVQNGYDTLVVANDKSRVTYSVYTSNNSADGCISSIVANLRNNGSISNFQIATTNDGEVLQGDGDGYAYVVVLFTAGGQDLARYYACFGGSGAILVFAFESPLADLADQVDDIETMLGQVRIP
jgi:hypothetical protein